MGNGEAALQEQPGAVVGLIAGDGQLPLLLARAARKKGLQVVGVGVGTDLAPELQHTVDAWHHVLGLHWQEVLSALEKAGVRDLYMVGKVSKTQLFTASQDDSFRTLSGELAIKNDNAVVLALLADMETRGIRVRPQTELLTDLLAPRGRLVGDLHPGEDQDITYGHQIAKAIGGLDLGQTVVVKQGAVLAVEAIEGTNAAILRGGELGGPGAVVVKAAKPNQDLRFDVPAVGLDTLAAMEAVGARVLAVDANLTFLVDQEQLVERARSAGICLVGIESEGGEAG